MPSIGKTLSKEERATVAAWLYDNYKGNWGGAMKKGSAKCGAVKIETH